MTKITQTTGRWFACKVVGPKPPEGYEVWWRADCKRYANFDPFAEFEQPSGSHLTIEVTPYIVIRTTPKGVWLQHWLGERFFVLGPAIRQRAVPTIQLALQDLVHRKKKHVIMAEQRAEVARQHLAAALRCYESC